jgi:tRNA dimethylallyltransferase
MGALDEAASLAGLDPALPLCKAVGVPELLRHLGGEIDLEAAISLAQQATRRYAKRQLTWFRNQMADGYWVNEQYSESLEQKIFSFIRQFRLTMAD